MPAMATPQPVYSSAILSTPDHTAQDLRLSQSIGTVEDTWSTDMTDPLSSGHLSSGSIGEEQDLARLALLDDEIGPIWT